VTRRDHESRLWAVLCALVLGIGIGGGALLHVIGRYFA
jgi:hypothetical protein